MDVFIANRDLEGLKDWIKNEKKNVIDEELVNSKIENSVRHRALVVTKSTEGSIEDLARQHFTFVMNLTKAGLCSKLTPIYTLQDFFETSSIEMCKKLFDIVEDHTTDFKNAPDVIQNTILRLCNDLLRRLSRIAETSFSGRIMFFLSRYLPLAEKSGLNLMGYFNTQNVTVYDQCENEAETLTAATSTNTAKQEEEEMETGEIIDEAKEIQVTPETYRQFWSLQKFFSNPALVFEKEKYLKFKSDISSVFSLLTTNKLEKSTHEDEEMEKKSKREKLASDDLFFSKYLTSPKLLALQLNDSQLRRNFLLQCLIVFQYLVMTEGRFKTGAKKLTLNEDQLKFVNDSEDKCYKLLSETMPRGSNFSAICKKILHREIEWSNWKNVNCPDYSEKADKAAMQMYKKRARVEFDPESLDLGFPELTNLWKNEPDVLKACKSDKRKFTPRLADFIRDPLDEMDPEQQVEEEYKSVNNSSFQWRASRLLIRCSPQYVQRLEKNSEPSSSMKEYLEKAIYNTAKNMEEFKSDIEERERKEESKKVEESLKRKHESSSKITASTSSPNPYAENSLTDGQLLQLANDLSGHVKQVAAVFNVPETESDKMLSSGTDKAEYCHQLLRNWLGRSKDKGSKALLMTLISDHDVVELATKSLKRILSDDHHPAL